MPVTTCICMKYGTRYGPEYPNRLFSGLRRNSASDIRLICMTEDATGLHRDIEVLPLADEPFHDRMFAAMRAHGWGAPFRKISLFRPDLIPDLDGPLLVLDIDIVITGEVSDLRDFAPGKISMRREWRSRPGVPSLGHGSVEKIEPRRHTYLYDRFARDPEVAMRAFGASEQNYTSFSAKEAGDLAFFPDEWIVSFKYDCRPPKPLNLILPPRRPPGARVVCFHGRPKMEDAVAGYRGGLLQSTRRAGWLADAWRD